MALPMITTTTTTDPETFCRKSFTHVRIKWAIKVFPIKVGD